MTLEQLMQAADRGALQDLDLLSHEGAVYLVEALIDGSRHLLKQHEGDTRPWVFRSLHDARNALVELPFQTINLVHLNVCDEMGPDTLVTGGPQAAMRLPLPLHP